MDKQIITFSANEQTLRKTGGLDIYASKTVSYIEAHFDLGQNWSGYDSVEAVWWNDYVRPVRTVLDTEGICVVPPEVLMRKGAVYVNLVGVISSGNVLTDRLTTHPITALTNKFNAQLGEGATTPLTPSEYEQFVATVKADADRAEDAKDSARGYAESASASAESAEEWADKAEQAASDAGYMEFHIDDNGHLIYERTSNVDQIDFSLVNGHLILEVA